MLFIAALFFGCAGVMFEVASWTFSHANYHLTFLFIVFAIVFLSTCIGLLRILSERIEFNSSNNVLALPYNMLFDTNHDAFNNSYSLYVTTLYFSKSLTSYNRHIPISEIKSVLVCRQDELKDFSKRYSDKTARKKIGSYLRFKEAQSSQSSRQLDYYSSFVASAVNAIARPVAISTIHTYVASPWHIVVQTTHDCIIKDLSWFLDSDPPYLAEALRASGVNVLNPKDGEIMERIQTGLLLPERTILSRGMKLLIVLFACVLILAAVIYFNP